MFGLNKMISPVTVAALLLIVGGISMPTGASAATCQFGTEDDYTASADVWTSTDCVGELEGNDAIGNNSGSNVDLNDAQNFTSGALFGSTNWELDTKIEVSGNEDDGFFFDTADPNGRLSAGLEDDALSGSWSVGNWNGVEKATLVLKGGNGFAAYLLDLTAGLEGEWSTQALFVGKNNNNNPTLSHVSLYTTPSPIPLPAAGWLLITALGGLGIAARRRRKAS